MYVKFSFERYRIFETLHCGPLCWLVALILNIMQVRVG
jgi:hypothetical protein